MRMGRRRKREIIMYYSRDILGTEDCLLGGLLSYNEPTKDGGIRT